MSESPLPHVLVTGGSRGIGRAIARDLGRDHHILVGGTRAETVDPVVAELPSAQPFICDLADPAATAEAVAGLDRLDVLVNSAGVGSRGPSSIGEAPRAEWQRVLEVDVVAVADLTRMVLPLLRARRGDVVMINSGSGLNRPGPGGGIYAAAKYALRALTDALREEERGRVRVTSIHPGRVDTDMQVALQSGSGRRYVPSDHLRPESVAAAVRLALAASEEAMVEELSIRPVRTL
ncbi:SDR family oxidoreductase [Acidipropionibacterium jensenii]|uniref:SDR family oxidoreductase n=1 Tax=Acidipropionibacterium jensenii TaxID=1749 RepID=UPI00214A915E|nr:SDR family oxidoreductase [Acidipropionibacterium jensenii]